MNTSRRGFLRGMAGILAAGVAPAIITTPNLLMPVKPLPPEYAHWLWTTTEGTSGVITLKFEVIVRELVQQAGGEEKWLEKPLGTFSLPDRIETHRV